MKRFIYEISESWKIAFAQMQSNKTRSMLTALGVIIGIVAVTLMGTAIAGIQTGFDKSMAIFGDDVLYVSQHPWARVSNWWDYRDRREIKTEYAEPLNRMIAATPNSNLVLAVPTSNVLRSVKRGDNQVTGIFVQGTTADYPLISVVDFNEGRFFNELENRTAANVCLLGYDVADSLFPSESPVGKEVLISGQQFRVLGVGARQGSFLGLFSLDSIVIVPLPTFKKFFSAKSESDVRVKVHAAGVCGSDLHGFLGRSKKRVPPLVLGHEFSGEIVAGGAGVSGFARGDSVAVYPIVDKQQPAGQALMNLVHPIAR